LLKLSNGCIPFFIYFFATRFILDGLEMLIKRLRTILQMPRSSILNLMRIVEGAANTCNYSSGVWWSSCLSLWVFALVVPIRFWTNAFIFL